MNKTIFPSKNLLEKHAPFEQVFLCPELTIRQTPDFFAFWEAWEHESGSIDIPYWAAVWPAAALTARFFLDNPGYVRGKRILDIGCGCGAASIAAAMGGALQAIANDIDDIALHIAAENATANKVVMSIDTTDYAQNPSAIKADIIVVADMFYQRTEAQAMFEALKNAHTAGVTILIADGGRTYAPPAHGSLLAEHQIPVSKALEGVSFRNARLYTLAL